MDGASVTSFKQTMFWGICLGLLCMEAEAQAVRSTSFTGMDSRADLIIKRVRVSPEGEADNLILKYDQKLTPIFAINIEWPAHVNLVTPWFSTSGHGDFFARARWIVPHGAWMHGAAVEVVLPVASDDALGMGRGQLNASGILIRVFSPSFLTALVLKRVSSVGGDENRLGFNNTEIRVIPEWLLADGYAMMGEWRYTEEHRTDSRWQRAEVLLIKRFDRNWAAQIGYSRDVGDRPDRGSFFVSTRYLF